MTYTPQIYSVRDGIGNTRSVEVQHDKTDNAYVGVIRSQKQVRMLDGSYRGEIIALGVANTPHDAAANAALNLDSRK